MKTNPFLTAFIIPTAFALALSGGLSASALSGDTTAPSVPTHVAPANNSTMTSADLNTIDWSDVTDPSLPVAYYYESSTSSATDSDGSFTTPIYESGALTTSMIPTPGTAEGTYYWHVRASDGENNMSAWSSPWKVTVDDTPDDIDTTAPGTPTHVSPANNSTMTSSSYTSADWSDVTDPSGPVVYDYEISHSTTTDSDGSFTTPAYSTTNLLASTIPTTGTAEGTYYWHVRAGDSAGNWSAWSEPWQITIDNDSDDEDDDGGPMIPTWWKAKGNFGYLSEGYNFKFNATQLGNNHGVGMISNKTPDHGKYTAIVKCTYFDSSDNSVLMAGQLVQKSNASWGPWVLVHVTDNQGDDSDTISAQFMSKSAALAACDNETNPTGSTMDIISGSLKIQQKQ